MILTGLLWLFIFVQEETPFKPKEEFEVKLNYSFKQRPAVESSMYRWDATVKDINNQNSSNMLPYLVLNLKIVNAPPTEVKLRVVSNRDANLFSKKVQSGLEFPIEMGFTDDVKDRITAYEYTVFFFDDKKKERTKIVIFVDKDGLFLVNGEVRGKL